MDFNALALECAPMVAPQTLAAIVRTESNFNALAININNGYRLERQPKNKDEAVVTAQWLINNRYNIDMGLGQVNSANLAKTRLSVEDAFDPCKNLAAAAAILKWNYETASRRTTDSQKALHAAISAYNTGSFTRGFTNGYVQKVLNSADVSNRKSAFIKQHAYAVPIKLASSSKQNSIKPVKQAMSQTKTSERINLEQKGFVDNARQDGLKDVSVVYADSLADSVMVYR